MVESYDVEEPNKLIAEFMGMQDTDLGWYDSENVMSEYACQIVGGNTFEVLQYDRSWDWLMPVVKKIRKVFNDYNNVQHRDCGSKNICDGLLTVDMHSTYDAVEEFINWYNKNKKE